MGNGTSENGSADALDAISSASAYPGSNHVTKETTAEDVARMVFTFVAASKAFTEGMDKSDDVKLLRLRTRKNEIVIVPGRSKESQHEADYSCR